MYGTFSEEAYESMVSAMFERHQSVQNVGFSGDAYKPGLEKMQAFDRALGFPSKRFRSIHVAGTNGKGSVCHMIAAALSVKDDVGLYTSPHLVDFRERARLVRPDGVELIPERAVFEFLTEQSALIDELGLSFFEITTGLAFWWFARIGVKTVVVETGLGGRLDATNIIKPVVSIITSIGLDHCAILGDTRAAIAAEKAGIFKPDVPAVIGSWDAETAPVFEKCAGGVGVEMFFADKADIRTGLSGTGASRIEENLTLDLRGDYQAMNLRTVLVALDVISGGDEVSKEELGRIASAAAVTGLRGRWEQIGGAPDVICDIGHNPPALKLNFAQLDGMMHSGKYDELTIVYGIMADKALEDILPLMPRNARYIFCAPATSRALRPELLAEKFENYFSSDVDTGDGLGPGGVMCSGGVLCPAHIVAPSVAEAVRIAIVEASPRTLIYIGGSAFVVAEALSRI